MFPPIPLNKYQRNRKTRRLINDAPKFYLHATWPKKITKSSREKNEQKKKLTFHTLSAFPPWKHHKEALYKMLVTIQW